MEGFDRSAPVWVIAAAALLLLILLPLGWLSYLSVSAEPNVLPGTVLRASYLGDSVDYQVRLAAGDVVLRLAAPASTRLRAGEAVTLRLPPEACIPLL